MALSEKDRTLLRLSVGIVLGEWELISSMRASAGEGEPDRAWREAVLQTHLFAGFPRVVEAFGVLAAAGGLGELEHGETRSDPDLYLHGRTLFARIYGDKAEVVRSNLHGYHPDFAAWIEGHAYGRVLARPGLAADRRELLAVACLAALGQDRQLASHARGALACGAEQAEVEAALDAVLDLIDAERMGRARRVVAGITVS